MARRLGGIPHRRASADRRRRHAPGDARPRPSCTRLGPHRRRAAPPRRVPARENRPTAQAGGLRARRRQLLERMRASAPGKINLGLVVGPLREDGKHELLTIYQRVGIADRIDVDPAVALTVAGFPTDTLVRAALEALAGHAGVEPHWRVTIEKRLPVAAGIGGGSSDAAAALQLANRGLEQPLDAAALHEVAAQVGADVPFFLRDGPHIGSGDGTALEAIDLPQDFWILLA